MVNIGSYSFNCIGMAKGYYIIKLSSGDLNQQVGIIITGKMK